jgi:hypothetical protein
LSFLCEFLFLISFCLSSCFSVSCLFSSLFMSSSPLFYLIPFFFFLHSSLLFFFYLLSSIPSILSSLFFVLPWKHVWWIYFTRIKILAAANMKMTASGI